MVTDAQGIIHEWSDGLIASLEYQADEVRGLYSPLLFHCPEEVALRSAELSRLFGARISGFHVLTEIAKREGAESREWTMIRKNQSSTVVRQHVTCLRDSAGNFRGYVFVHTKPESDGAQLESGNELIRKLSATCVQADFKGLDQLERVIRSPLNAILGYASLLKQDIGQPDGLRFLNHILDSGKELEVQVAALLERVELETGSTHLDSPGPLREILADVERMWKPLLQRSGTGFTWDVRDLLCGGRIMTFTRRMRSLLNHYLPEVAGYAKGGWVHIQINPDPLRSGILSICFITGGRALRLVKRTSQKYKSGYFEPTTLLNQIQAVRIQPNAPQNEVGVRVQLEIPPGSWWLEYPALNEETVGFWSQPVRIGLLETETSSHLNLKEKLDAWGINWSQIQCSDHQMDLPGDSIPDILLVPTDIRFQGNESIHSDIKSRRVFGLVGPEPAKWPAHRCSLDLEGLVVMPVQQDALRRIFADS